MLFTDAIFAGVDTTGGQQSFTMAVLDQTARLVAMTEGELDSILSFAGGHSKAFFAINSPSRPNNGALQRLENRANLPSLHKPGRGVEMRLAEHQLRERGISVGATSSKAETAPNWIQLGFMLYEQLNAMGYHAFPSEGAPLQWLETHPHAVFCALLGHTPLARHSLEGRIQRQLILLEQGLVINDPMEFYDEITRHGILKGELPLHQIYGSNALDALAAAYTALRAARSHDSILKLGAPDEGLIFLPVTELRAHY
jgi:hypothetical protein